MVWPWVPKWYPATPIFLQATLNTSFYNQYNDPITELYPHYIDDCISAPSTREELNQVITTVNLFHPALKYTWEISDTSIAFLDIKVSIKGNGLYTSVLYKPAESHSSLFD